MTSDVRSARSPRRGVDPVQAARMTGHSLDVFTRHYAGDYGKAQRDEARARMLAAGVGESVSTAVSTEAASGETGATSAYAKT